MSIGDDVVGSDNRIEGNSLCELNEIPFALFDLSWMHLFVARRSWMEMILHCKMM